MTDPKPYLRNADDVPWTPFEHGRFASDDKYVLEGTNHRRLGACLTRLMPGQTSCPFHFHHVGEELFIIVEGQGTLRYGDETRPIRANDVITCPPGKESAHQFINDSTGPLVYWAIGTEDDVEICEYPDSGKTLTKVKGQPSAVFRQADAVDYFLGEE
jgi:uncharacterized cupin superfamily protein